MLGSCGPPPETVKLTLLLDRDWKLNQIDSEYDFRADSNLFKIDSFEIPALLIEVTKGEHDLQLISFYGDVLDTAWSFSRSDTVSLTDLTVGYYQVHGGFDHWFKETPSQTSIVRDHYGRHKLFVYTTDFGCFHYHRELNIYEKEGSGTKITTVIDGESFSLVEPVDYSDSLARMEANLYDISIKNCGSTSGTRYTLKCGREILYSRNYSICYDLDEFLSPERTEP